jgi:ribosomal protein S18 acetylase RimI-like enzyme
MSEPVIENAKQEDLPAILQLQKLCFREAAERYNDFSIPPLAQTLAGLEDDFRRCVILKLETESGIIGSVRAFAQDELVHIGRLIVHPDFQNHGLGKRLMREIEKRFPRARRFELFTGVKDEKNIHFYTRLGYRVYGEKRKDNLIFLEKVKTEAHG